MLKRNNIYLLYGEEKYDLNRKLESIKKGFDKLENGVNLFYITKENIDTLKDVLTEVTFFGSHKLVIIKDTNLKFDVELLKDVDSEIVVVITEESVDKRTASYKAISKIAEVLEFKALDRKAMTTYVHNLLKRYNINLDFDTADYFVEVCGLDKNNNVNEIKKIVIFLEDKEDKKLTKELIDSICSKTLNAKIFDVLNKIVNKEKQDAISSLDDLLKQKESIVKIYIMLYKQIKQMYMIKYLKEKNEANIASKLGIHPYTFKLLSVTCNKYTKDELKNIMYMFDEYDEKTKMGEMDFEIGLKKIICSM